MNRSSTPATALIIGRGYIGLRLYPLLKEIIVVAKMEEPPLLSKAQLYRWCLECIEQNLIKFINGVLFVDELKLNDSNQELKYKHSQILKKFHSIIHKILVFCYKRARGNHPRLFTGIYSMRLGTGTSFLDS